MDMPLFHRADLAGRGDHRSRPTVQCADRCAAACSASDLLKGRRQPGVLRRGQEPGALSRRIAAAAIQDSGLRSLRRRRHLGPTCRREQRLSRGDRSRTRPHRAAAAAGSAPRRRCRSRITTASTPTWAAANIRARPASPDRPSRSVSACPATIATHSAGAHRAAGGDGVVEITDSGTLRRIRRARPSPSKRTVTSSCAPPTDAAPRCCSAASIAVTGGAESRST